MLIFYLCYLYLFTYTGVQHDFYIRWCSCYSTATRRVPLMKHLALSSPPIFSPIRVVQCQVFRVVFSISFCSFSSGYCIIYTSMIYDFWLLYYIYFNDLQLLVIVLYILQWFTTSDYCIIYTSRIYDFWLLYYIYFNDLQLLIIPLISSNFLFYCWCYWWT
jgi:hypothetical protein